jgi:hypothetical protein
MSPTFAEMLQDKWDKKKKRNVFAPDRSSEICYTVRTPGGHTYTLCKPGMAEDSCPLLEMSARGARPW